MTAIRSTSDVLPIATPGEESAPASAGGAPESAGRATPKAESERGRVYDGAAKEALGPRAARMRQGGRTITVGIVGATGYAGGELVRLLLNHPRVRLTGLHGRNRDNVPIADSHPHLSATGLVIDQAIPEADAIFTALPHGVAA
jgi:hypothetical protein